MPLAFARPPQLRRSTLAYRRLRRRRLGRSRGGFCWGFWGLARNLRRQLAGLPQVRDLRFGHRASALHEANDQYYF